MATMTLLEMVQNILGAMESDEVNDIGDTVESAAVAMTLKETYFDLISLRDWPFLRNLSSLTALGDTDNPTKMRFPTGVNKVYWIKYNKKDVTFLDPKEFRDMIDNRVAQAGIINASGYVINADPQYWTSYDDDYVYFDGIDLVEEATLQQSKSSAYILIVPTWTVSNVFTPMLPEKMFPTLLADAKGTCFLNYKQTSNTKEERKAQRGRVRMQNEAWRNNKGESMTDSNINYGRGNGRSTSSRMKAGS